jgi:dipeptide transport system permease protein
MATETLVMAAPPGPFLAFWRSFRENRGAVIGLAVVCSVVFIAIFADFIAPYSPIEQYRGFTRLPPIWAKGGNWAYPWELIPGRTCSRAFSMAHEFLFISLSVMLCQLCRVFCWGCCGLLGWHCDVVIIRVMDLILAFQASCWQFSSSR